MAASSRSPPSRRCSSACSAACGRSCGCVPRDLTGAVREGDTRTASAGGRRLGNGLVVAEIAIAFALLVGAGLLVKNLLLLSARDAGMRTDRIVAFNVAPTRPALRSARAGGGVLTTSCTRA